jgi:hypothetical protein
VQVTPASAQKSAGAVNAPGTWQAGTGTLPAGASGSAVAAAFTNNNGTPNKTYKVGNDAAAGAAETAILDRVVRDALAIPPVAKNPVARANAIKAVRREIADCTQPDAAGVPPNCAPNANAGTFALVNKAVNTSIKSDTGIVQGVVGGTTVETAQAKASQTLSVKNNAVVNTPNDSADASVEKGGKSAVAFTSNRDPLAIQWSSPASRSVTVDLSQVTLNPSTSGTDTAALTFFATSTAFIDNTTDLAQPENDARLLFDLLLPTNSIDGVTSALDMLAFGLTVPCALTVPTSCTVSDDVNGTVHSGLAVVTADLLADFKPTLTGVWAFTLPYSFTVTLPGVASQSVLFMQNTAFADAATIPEPPGILLVGTALAALLARRQLSSAAH